MTSDIDKYLIPLDGLDLDRIISTWTWLVGDKSVVALTKAGDALLKDKNDNLYFLETGGGTLEHKASNYRDFIDNNLDIELTEELLLKPVVDRLKNNGIKLNHGQVYSYILLPIMGGAFDGPNRYALNIYEHYNVTGDLHFQLKDTPYGTSVDVVVKK